MDAKSKRAAVTRRRQRVRKRIRGSAEKPRLSVYRSARHIYAQVIDDGAGRTLAAASSLDVRDESGDKAAVAKKVGEILGSRAKDSGVTTVVFDRGGRQYAGRVKALAEGAREAGLNF